MSYTPEEKEEYDKLMSKHSELYTQANSIRYGPCLWMSSISLNYPKLELDGEVVPLIHLDVNMIKKLKRCDNEDLNKLLRLKEIYLEDLDILERAHRLCTDKISPLKYIVKVCHQLGDYKKALDYYTKVKELSQHNKDLEWHIKECLYYSEIGKINCDLCIHADECRVAYEKWLTIKKEYKNRKNAVSKEVEAYEKKLDKEYGNMLTKERREYLIKDYTQSMLIEYDLDLDVPRYPNPCSRFSPKILEKDLKNNFE